MQLEAKNLCFRYSEKSPWILNDISLTVSSGERVGIVGPSGCGKSTLAKILSGYERPNSGELFYNGKPLPDKGYCPVQMIYQHPELSVNPRWKMAKILNEAWNPDEKILEKMGIEKAWLTRWPSELSGGELQRFCIARALSPQTNILVCDEITTMLDVITQAQMIDFLRRYQQQHQTAYLFITHSTALAEQFCDEIVNMEDGRLGTLEAPPQTPVGT